MSRRRTFWTAYAVGFAVAGLIAIFAISEFHKLVPQSVDWQALQLTDLEGKPVTLEDYPDKVLLVNVWATWCKPCIKEMSSLDALQQQYPENLAVLTISDEETAKLEQFKSSRDYSFDFLKANAPLASQSLTVYPTTYLLSKDGEVEVVYLGEQNWSGPLIQEQLEQLF